jgi:hypothetical protein
MNSLEQLITDESLDESTVLWWCRDRRLISDNCPDLNAVPECDAGKAVEAIREARRRRDAAKP